MRPLKGGRAWVWRWREPSIRSPWNWCRIYHRSNLTPDAVTHRRYGPLHRLDHHIPDAAGQPQESQDGRSILYVAGNLTTALGEVFGDYTEAAVCPNQRIALVRPTTPLHLLDLRGQGAAMRIGALPSLATGDYPRNRTQEWARAIHNDQPVAHRTIRGIHYDAAHSNGPALTLWGTEGTVEVVNTGAGQDFALADPRIWPRVVTAVGAMSMRADLVARCPRCP